MKNKHMSLEDRCKIEKCLNNNLSFKSIANEIVNHLMFVMVVIRKKYVLYLKEYMKHYIQIKNTKIILKNLDKVSILIKTKLII